MGDVVRQRRLNLGLTQEQLAHRSGVSLATIRSVETGRVRKPYSLPQIYRALDLDESMLRTFSHPEQEGDGAPMPDGEPMSIDEFLAQDPNLDELSRKHYRQQYDHLVHATEARRRVAAQIPQGSGWRDDEEINRALSAWQAEHGRFPSSPEEASEALRSWRDRQ